jgi:hypothetical protein
MTSEDQISIFSAINRVVDLDAEIPDCASNLGMPMQELDSPKVSDSPVDELDGDAVRAEGHRSHYGKYRYQQRPFTWQPPSTRLAFEQISSHGGMQCRFSS